MKLTPDLILQHLGFQLPADGIEIAPADVEYHLSALKLLGRTLSADLIPDQALHDRHAALTASQASEASCGNDAAGAAKSRATLRIVMESAYGISI